MLGRNRATRVTVNRRARRLALTRQGGPDLAAAQPDGVGAVVVGGDYQGLGIVRSIGRRGFPVCVIDDERSIARFSRYATYSTRVTTLRNERSTVATLLDLGHRLGLKGWVLFPTREETVAAFARNTALLGELYRVPTPSWTTVQWAWDKRKTYELAKELGIPTPRIWYPRSVEELESIEWDGPFALKPAIKENFFYSTKAKAWRANNRTELRTLFQRATALIAPEEVMIQELIPGDGHYQFAYCAFFKEGNARASMVVRRMRQHPPEFGRASTFVETIDLPELEALSERFLRAIDYYGLVEIEYKLDPLTDEYKILDVNARTWGYHSLGQRAGIDFPALLFADQLGFAIDGGSQARAGVKWIRLTTDVPTAMRELAAGRIDRCAYVRSLLSFDVEAVFERDDILPGLAELVLLPSMLRTRGF